MRHQVLKQSKISMWMWFNVCQAVSGGVQILESQLSYFLVRLESVCWLCSFKFHRTRNGSIWFITQLIEALLKGASTDACRGATTQPRGYFWRTYEAECCSNSAGNGPFTAYNPENKVCCSDGSTQNFLTGCSEGSPVNNYANFAKLPL